MRNPMAWHMKIKCFYQSKSSMVIRIRALDWKYLFSIGKLYPPEKHPKWHLFKGSFPRFAENRKWVQKTGKNGQIEMMHSLL